MSRKHVAGSLVLIALAAWVVCFQADRPSTVATVRAADPDAPIDWNRARLLLAKERRGEPMTDQERAYLDRAKRERQRMAAQRPTTQPDWAGRGVARDSIGEKPLSEMTAAGRYKGEDGGLYGGGQNAPPKAHAEAAARELAKIVPRDADGKPAPAGRIVLMSIGMSNTTQEFSRFKQLADADPARRPEVVIVDAAQGGQAAAEWDEQANPAIAARVWTQAERRLQAAGVTPAQVQAVWIKQALKGPARYGAFPAHAKAQKGHTVAILHAARRRLPNLRVAYLSSRIYGGYGPGPLNPEPFAYEGAFAVRWIILDQIKEAADRPGGPRSVVAGEPGGPRSVVVGGPGGPRSVVAGGPDEAGRGSKRDESRLETSPSTAAKPVLNWDPARGEVKSPIVLWGPYLWADGVNPRKPDGLLYKRSDLAGDGTHPSQTGRQKVADQLLTFFKTDPLAKSWFAKPPTAPTTQPAD